ncbi:hypothetical protein UPYG_G00286610 [Umbra pygmaea]|uniref:Plasminogen receptor (KT) n=1 Tax=Umbra pygmaea TaxID=75934 RepID=A0ABD0W460_UMBPY
MTTGKSDVRIPTNQRVPASSEQKTINPIYLAKQISYCCDKGTMGFMLSKSMDQTFRNQQEFMLHNARLQMERQILMQNQMRERQMAMQIAWSREFLKYYGTFFSLAAFGLTMGAIRKRRPYLFVPIIPLGFVLSYQMDMAYGTLIYRMRGEAENILESEHDRLALPHGTLSFESIEKERKAKSSLSSLLEK